MAELRVRRVRKDELAELLGLYRHLHEADDPLPAGPQLEVVWSEILSSPRLHYLVGELDGQLIASCTLAIVPNLTRGARPYGLIENVVTRRDCRGRGFATQVLQHALRIAWESGCYKVMLLTGRKDEATLRFYERAGFQRGVKTGFVAYPPSSG